MSLICYSDILKKLAIDSLINNDGNIFQKFHYLLDQYHDRECHTMIELQKRNTKLKGDLFENFCLLYLHHVLNFQYVVLYKDCPKNILEYLGLKYNGDFGIDIIAWNDNKWFAIQCKYRKQEVSHYQHHRSDVIGWKEVSTFYALTSKTGPWYKNIIMTTGSSVRRVNLKNNNDIILTKKHFEQITVDQWYKCFSIVGNSSNSNKIQNTNTNTTQNTKPSTVEELRSIRNKFFAPQTNEN